LPCSLPGLCWQMLDKSLKFGIRRHIPSCVLQAESAERGHEKGPGREGSRGS
jgi:hypothetical protein